MLRIKYGPNESSVMHYHPESVVVYLTNSEGSFKLDDGKTMKASGKMGDVILAPAGKHLPSIANKPLEVIQVELKENKKPRWTDNAPEIDVIKASLKDYESGNWESWRTRFADTAKIYHNTLEGKTAAQSQEALAGTIKKLASYKFSDKDLYFERIIDNNGTTWVYFWGTWEAKVAATGKSLVVPVHLAFKMVDNKIAREYGYYDMSELMKL